MGASMSTPSPAAEAEGAEPASAKKPRGKRKLLLLLAVPLLVGAGAGGWAMASGKLPFVSGAAEDPSANLPKLVPAEGRGAGGPRYQTSYAKLEGAFTSNLRNSGRFVQVELGVATRYDERVLDAVATHELPVRSAVLTVLARQPEEGVTTEAGRARLQQELRVAINKVLEEQTGFGGIERVYFSGLVVQ